jgi:hypothetical protein
MKKPNILEIFKSLNDEGSTVKPNPVPIVKKVKAAPAVKPILKVRSPDPVMTKIELFLNPAQVKALIKQAEQEGEVIVVRCKRKTGASKPGGPDAGQLYDLHCGTKPSNYKFSRAVDYRAREAEDDKNNVLTVFATNRRAPGKKLWGAWRRVNLDEVQKIIYRTHEYEVTSK